MHKPIYTFLVVKMQLIHAKADLRFLRCKNKQKFYLGRKILKIYSPVANAFASLRSPLRFASAEMTEC